MFCRHQFRRRSYSFFSSGVRLIRFSLAGAATENTFSSIERAPGRSAWHLTHRPVPMSRVTDLCLRHGSPWNVLCSFCAILSCSKDSSPLHNSLLST